MKEPVKPIGIVAAIAVLLIALGGGVTWWILSSRQTLEPDILPVPSPSPSETLEPTQPPRPPDQLETLERTVEIYRVQDQNGEIEWIPTPVTVQVTEDNPALILEAAFLRLLAQPTDENRFSEIPPQTELLGVQGDANQVYVDLSQEFTTGGGSASMIGRLGQVIYTASSLNPNAKIWISVNGQPLEILGGEGLEVAQPTSRQNFQAEFQSNSF